MAYSEYKTDRRQAKRDKRRNHKMDSRFLREIPRIWAKRAAALKQ